MLQRGIYKRTGGIIATISASNLTHQLSCLKGKRGGKGYNPERTKITQNHLSSEKQGQQKRTSLKDLPPISCQWPLFSEFNQKTEKELINIILAHHPHGTKKGQKMVENGSRVASGRRPTQEERQSTIKDMEHRFCGWLKLF